MLMMRSSLIFIRIIVGVNGAESQITSVICRTKPLTGLRGARPKENRSYAITLIPASCPATHSLPEDWPDLSMLSLPGQRRIRSWFSCRRDIVRAVLDLPQAPRRRFFPGQTYPTIAGVVLLFRRLQENPYCVRSRDRKDP